MRTKILIAGILVAWDVAAQAQTAQEQPVEIVVEVDKPTQYQPGTFDVGKLARDPSPNHSGSPDLSTAH